MMAIDTNVLVRILIEDPEQGEQIKLARSWARKHKQLFITQIVQIELVWVLKYVYKLEKRELLVILQHMAENEAFFLQNAESFEAAINIFSQSSTDFSDCLIYIESQQANTQMITFDKKFAKLMEVKLLS